MFESESNLSHTVSSRKSALTDLNVDVLVVSRDLSCTQIHIAVCMVQSFLLYNHRCACIINHVINNNRSFVTESGMYDESRMYNDSGHSSFILFV